MLRSHLDPCTLVVFLHVKGDFLEDDLASVVRALDLRHTESYSPILERLHPRSEQLLFHETYHYWQSLRLPFLARYAMVSFHLVFRAFMDLARTGTSFKKWSCRIPDLETLSRTSYIALLPGGRLALARSKERLPRGAVCVQELSPLIMLECAASLAEFQVSTGNERTQPAVFRRWIKRNAAYTSVFDFVSRVVESDELALRALLPMLNACFHTSIPERAFVGLLARLWGRFVSSNANAQFLAQKEPCRWTDLFQDWLGELDYDIATADANLDENVFGRLTLDEWVYGGYVDPEGAKVGHPYLAPAARRWRELEVSDPTLSWFMDLPGWGSRSTGKLLSSELYPPITVYRFHLGDGADKILINGVLPNENSGSTQDQVSGSKGFLIDFLAMYGAVRQANRRHLEAEHHTCHHLTCPHFATNYCNVYPLIPDRFQDCGFPARMERLIHEWS